MFDSSPKFSCQVFFPLQESKGDSVCGKFFLVRFLHCDEFSFLLQKAHIMGNLCVAEPHGFVGLRLDVFRISTGGETP